MDAISQAMEKGDELERVREGGKERGGESRRTGGLILIIVFLLSGRDIFNCGNPMADETSLCVCVCVCVLLSVCV